MLRHAPPVSSSELERLFHDLMREQNKLLEMERRSVHREPFARPVSVLWIDIDRPRWETIAKNLSTVGIGLLVPGTVDEGERAKLLIHRPRHEPSAVLAECRWCQEYCGGWQLSGWKFSALVR